MKLLILTQKVDQNDPVLGFFHNWLSKLASHFEKISVVCLEKGTFELPTNIKIYSLGKEVKRSRLLYVKNFYQYVTGLHSEYDAVFVHMNQEYVLLGGLLWKLLRKKVYFWRNHPKGDLLTYLAVLLSDKVFCTSDNSFTARFKKINIMPVGIDTERFKNLKIERLKDSILFLGRMDPIKNPKLLVEALGNLNKRGAKFITNFYGDPTPGSEQYYDNVKVLAKDLGLEDKVFFHSAVPNDQTPKIYQDHVIYVNLTPSGSLDKTILEAVACGCVPVVVNNFFTDVFDPNMTTLPDQEDLVRKLDFWLVATRGSKSETLIDLEKYVERNHSLSSLVNKLVLTIK